MKKILSILIIGLLASCSSLTNDFTSRQYDPVEYNYAIMIATNATHAAHLCKQQGTDYFGYLQNINHDSLTLVEYVTNKADTEQALPAAEQIRDITMEFLSRPNRSLSYCLHKVNNIQASARMYARGVANSSKFDPCSGNPEDRLIDFKKSYDTGLLNKDEFMDLSGDLLKLTKIDASSCTLENRAKMDKLVTDLQTIAGLATL